MTISLLKKNDFYEVKTNLKIRLVKAAQAVTDSISSILTNIIDRTPRFSNASPTGIIRKNEFIGIPKVSAPQKKMNHRREPKSKTQVKRGK